MSATMTMSMTYTPVTRTRPAAAAKESTVKNIALFMIAPFVGLVYAMLFPFFALGTLAWIGGKALIESVAVKAALRHAKKLAMIASAPVVGLLFVTTFPVAGIAALVWMGLRGTAPAGLGA